MRNIILLIISFFALSNLANTAYAETGQTINGLNWHYFSDETFESAKKENKTVMMFAMSRTCQWCHKMQEETLVDSVIIEFIKSHFYPVILDVNTEKSDADKLNISSVPTMIYFDEKGKTVKKYRGYASPSDLLQQMAVANLLVHETR